MATSVMTLGLALAFFFLTGTNAATFTITNNCPFTIWPGTLTGGGRAQLSTTGFQLAPKASATVQAPAPWSGRFWARTGCGADGTGKFACATADCGSGQVACNGAGAVPPASLVELTLSPNGGKDFYDISLVDGFNLPVSVTPQGGYGGSTISCPVNINGNCPAVLQMKGRRGSVLACKSACLAFKTPEYCCTGEFASPDKCKPTGFSQAFKSQCPQAYSYAFDDKSSTFTCAGGANYLIAFCP